MSGNASVGNSVEDWATGGISGTSQAASGQGLGAVVGLPNGNGSASTGTPYSGDTSQLGAFIASGVGAQYAASYNPTNLYAQVGTSVQSYAPGENLNQTTVGQDVSAMMTAYQSWLSGNQQTQTNWATMPTPPTPTKAEKAIRRLRAASPNHNAPLYWELWQTPEIQPPPLQGSGYSAPAQRCPKT